MNSYDHIGRGKLQSIYHGQCSMHLGVLIEVEVPNNVGEASSFGKYTKVTILHEFQPLDRSFSSISLEHTLQS